MPNSFSTTNASAPEETTLESLATSPRRVRTDEGTIEERPAEDLIKLDVYNAQKDQAGTPLFGIAVGKAIPGSSVGGYRVR